MFHQFLLKCSLFPEVSAVYGDIIKFYNEIYMQEMTPYAWNFSEKQKLVS